MKVHHLSQGIRVSTFLNAPASFDPTLAEGAELKKYGYPPRPIKSGPWRDLWRKLAAKGLKRVEPEFQETTRKHRPRRASTAGGTESSDNWSGAVLYAPPGVTWAIVGATWQVPAPTAPSNDGVTYYASSWIGIDGDNSADVFQAGVESEATFVGGSMQRTYYAWWEWYPAFEVMISNFPVAPGDNLSCALVADSSTTGTLYLTNTTQGTYTSFGFSAPAGTSLVGNCAEWIVERPDVNGEITNLANYNQVLFDTAVAQPSSGEAVIAVSQGNAINMTDGTAVISKGAIVSNDQVTCTYSGP